MVRLATKEDIDILADMALEFALPFEHDRISIKMFMARLISSPAHILMVSEDDRGITGSIAGGTSPWMFNFDITVLHEMWWFVPKKFREHRSPAFPLFKALMKWGKDEGATMRVISSTEREESPRVIKFYKKLGLTLMDHNYVGGF